MGLSNAAVAAVASRQVAALQLARFDASFAILILAPAPHRKANEWVEFGHCVQKKDYKLYTVLQVFC